MTAREKHRTHDALRATLEVCARLSKRDHHGDHGLAALLFAAALMCIPITLAAAWVVGQ